MINLYNLYNAIEFGITISVLSSLGIVFIVFIILAWIPIGFQWMYLIKAYRAGPDEMLAREAYVKCAKCQIISAICQLIFWPLFTLLAVGPQFFIFIWPYLITFGIYACISCWWLQSAKNYLIELKNRKNLNA